MHNPPVYYYSLQLERNKLGTFSTKVIKEQVNRIRKKCQSIVSLSEKGDLENTSTNDTYNKGGNFLQKVVNTKKVNKNHRYSNNQKFLNRLKKIPNKQVRVNRRKISQSRQLK
mmetsp:Transcript_29460/g.26032  ORF Transcript_29460/g.26032 Transcript_29460/m.26032 type:complete len:113 (+) Transcript_29460:565-903(+)